MKRAILKITLALALAAGALSVAVPSQANPDCKKDKDGICIMIYAPVICDHGKIYGNACLAELDCATGCVPYLPPAAE